MKSKNYLIILAVTGIALFFWLESKNQEPKEDNRIHTWRYKKFSMEVGSDEWNGKLEQGEYTKSGILIIKQNGK
ncbi:hypothetical protein [Flavobacterium sp.]|jgi:hypothetical protein|uniref:hypothetical protein n=1 Tax=Flavobacterium sp. TaxID=239 RepID=UPI0037BFA3D5